MEIFFLKDKVLNSKIKCFKKNKKMVELSISIVINMFLRRNQI